ncbi:polycystin-1 [Aulostomus maculatus]
MIRTGSFASRQRLQVLWVLWMAAAAEDVLCPKGSHIHLSSLRCYWLSESTSSWSEAQDSCRHTQGGDLAAADSLDLQKFLHNSFPVRTSVWVWLKGSRGDQDEGGGEKQAMCPQLVLGTLGQRRRTGCAGQYHFFCEKDVTESLPSLDSYLVGLVLLTGIHSRTQINSLPSVPDIGQLVVEMQLFPGLWFTHAGQLTSVELVVQPSPASSLARVQILRPYCNPNHHLVPPGCISLLNPFSCCSVVPLCNTTGGCSMGQYWCHLLEACLPTTSACSPYVSAAVSRGFASPPRYPAIPPFYHLVADLPLRINPASELATISVTLPEEAIMVYPDDILTVQHTRDSGTFLHCLSRDASLNSPWRQSYLSFRGTEWGGWWEGGLTFLPQGGQWVDEVVCDLRILYMDTLHRGTEHEDILGVTHTETTTASDIRTPSTVPTPRLGLNIILPLPDEKNQIHVLINTPTIIIVKVWSGEKAKSSWSAPVLQTGLPFRSSCPELVAQSVPACKRESEDAWFSAVTLVLPSTGVQMLNISVKDEVRSQSLRVKVCGYEAVTGLSVEPHGHMRMLIDSPQSFTAKVEGGSSVTFSWVIDNLEKFAYIGESYSVVFKKPAKYNLQVTASNPVSSQSQQILLTADEMVPLAEPELLFLKEVVAVNVSHLYILRVRVDISLPVTFRWDFGDGSSSVLHTQSAPCKTTEGLVERGERQVYVQHSVNHTYPIPGDFTINVQVSNQYESIDTSSKASVRPQLNLLFLSYSPLNPLVNQTLLLQASIEPSANNTAYTWHFGDNSKNVHGTQRSTTHAFASAGVYNVTLSANNTVSVLTAWLMVEVLVKVSGLRVRYNGPSELSTATDVRATVASGTSLIWNFDFGDGSQQGNLTTGSISHVYKSPGNYTVGVTVFNKVSQAHQSICVEVFRLAVSKVLPSECVVTGRNIELTALVKGNASLLTFHWLFGDGSPLTILMGKSTVTHTFTSRGVFHVNLILFSSVTSVSYNRSICVETPLSDVMVQTPQNTVAAGEEVCFQVLVTPEQTSCHFTWCTSFSSPTALTENAHKCFVFKNEGVEEVFVTARNKVSNKTAKVSITIQKPVSNLSVSHSGENGTIPVKTSASFWVVSCAGSNVSVLWDFGDGSPAEAKQNVSHVFTSSGQFTVTATAFNAISQDSVTLKVNILHPISDFSLHIDQPFAVAGEEMLITAVSRAVSSTNYHWAVDGLVTMQQGTYQFRFTFPKAGVYLVKAIAQNMVSRREAVVSVEVFERIEGPHIECQSLINMKYIPTQEELLFIASVTKGSNVTYHWLATHGENQEQISEDGELFHLLVETPDRVSVQLSASNKLGETTSTVSIVAVERVTSAHMTTQSNIVAVGKSMNISVSIVTGSDLQYFWYVDNHLSPLQTNVPFLLHTFTSLGHSFVRVSVQNVLSQSNDTKLFLVQEEIEEVDFRSGDRTAPFLISAGAAVSFQGLINKGSDLHWDWQVKGATAELRTAINQTFIYTFLQEGVYVVSLNVSNEINWQAVSHSVTVQDAIEDLRLNISKSTVCTEEQVTFIPTISKGSNLSFVLTFKNKDWTLSQNVIEGQFTTSSLPAGMNRVTLKAVNQVSSAEVSRHILVIEGIKGLELVRYIPNVLEAAKGIDFEVKVQNIFPVSYTWRFHLEGSEPLQLTGQQVIYTPPASGSLSLSVLASNGVCSKMLNETAHVEWPVKDVTLVCLSERIFVGFVVGFSAKSNVGSKVRYEWDFGDSTQTLVTDISVVNHTYHMPSKYSIMVKVSNSISSAFTQLQLDVEELQCSSPQVSLIQSQPTIFRSRPNIFEASMDINCSAYKTTFLWRIFRMSHCTNGSMDYTGAGVGLRDAASPFLLLPKCTLDVGQYCLVFTASLQGTPLLVQQKTKVTVVHSPLLPVIKGGSHRMWPSYRDLVLDGTESRDPDVEPGVEDALQYHWTYMIVNSTQTHSEGQCIDRNSSVMTVLSNHVHPDKVYIFTLTVTICEAPVLPVLVECVSCSSLSSTHHISHSTSIILSAQCGQCDDEAEYRWRSEDQTGMTLELAEAAASRRHSHVLVVRSGVLQPGQIYTFTVNVTQPSRGRWGSAGLTVLPNSPPRGGQCELHPESHVRLLETVVSFNCSGWQDEDEESESSQVIYTFQVVPCKPNMPMCPVLTLYRGTRSVFGSMVPVGTPGKERNTSVITVSLLVEDSLGAKVVALNRTLIVETPVRDSAAGQWLRNKSQTELWALVQHGYPQEIIPYSIALTSQLNQMESAHSIQELSSRREIRENVTRALVSLSISSFLDVDQVSSALLQSTAVPGELVCDGCREKVLEAVGKMIHVMEEQMIPGVLTTLDTGRNILTVIGSSLAAVSESVSSSSTPESASAIALSALGHAGSLMRSLIHSRVHAEAPLSIITPYINAVGFQGNPSDLLCTQQSSQLQTFLSQSSLTGGSKSSCPFQIPTSLTAQLRSQRPELVQVLFGIDGALESHPLLTAANPPISTALVAMELSTPQGQPIPIQDLDPNQAIQVTLPNSRHGGRGGGQTGGTNGTWLTVTLPSEGQLNFTVKPVDDFDENAGLFISFNFSLAPGAPPVSLGHVRVEMSSMVPATNDSQDSIVKERALTLSAETTFTEETIFLSSLLNGTDQPLSVNLTSSLVEGGPVHVSVRVFSSLCRYYSLKERRWSSEGLQPLEGSTLHAARCQSQHLTMFGATLFVHPGAIVLLPPSSGPMRNVVVEIVCAVLVLIHLLVGLIAHKLDHLDSLRLSQVPLCGRPGLYHYRVLVKTGRRQGAGTTAHVGISLYGVNKSGSRHLQRDGAFQRGSLDQFHLETDDNLGEVWKIRIWHDNTGLDPSWYVQHVVVWDPMTDHMFFFLVEDWLSVENQRNGTVEKEVLASCPDELSQFRRVFTSQLMFGVVERHLWLSLWDRPAHSRFTRAQRVTCSALMLHLYLALGALWYGAVGSEGHSGPVSAHLLVNLETVAVGMTVAVLVFPLQCFLCFLFRKSHSQVMVDMSRRASPVCHSVEMDIHISQSELSGPSFLSLPNSSSPVQDSPSSLLGSNAFDSSILDFWAASGLVPQTDGVCLEEGVWASCDSLLNVPGGPSTKTTMTPDLCKSSSALGSTRPLRRKKAVLQLCLAGPSSSDSSAALLPPLHPHPCSHPAPSSQDQDILTVNTKPLKVHNQNLTTFLTLSEEDLLMSIAAATENTVQASNSNSDSGRDSPRTTSSFSNTQSTSCSSWSDQSEDKYFDDAELQKSDAPSCPSLYEAKLYKCPSALSVDSVASTFLPSPSPDSTCSPSTTRIGVARSHPSWLFPPWVQCVIYSVVAMLLGSCLAVVGLYGTSFSRAVVLMWLTSAFSAFLTSALLLEPLKVFVQALIYTAVWRPVDPEVEDQLAQDTTVVRAFGEHVGKVRPPCGYGLLQAKEEARKVRALQSLMRQCVCQLLFLLLVLMVNYQDTREQRQGRLLHTAVRHRLLTAPLEGPNLTSVRDWSGALLWINHNLVTHIHQNPLLHLVGLPQLQYTHTQGPTAGTLLGNSSAATQQLLADLHMEDWSTKEVKAVSVDFTHYHRESGLFVSVSVQLKCSETQRIRPSLSILPHLIPSSLSGLDLPVVLTVLLLISALLIIVGELWSMATRRALHGVHLWLQLLLALLSLATSVLHLCFLWQATSCVSKLRSQPNSFINFHRPALLAQRSSQCAAVLLTLLVLKLLGTLRFVRRWIVIGRVLHRAWRDLCALSVLLLLLLLLCTHLGNTLFSGSVEGFLSVHQAAVSVLSILRGHIDLSRLCRVHPVLGPMYGLLLMGGGVWFLARLCGAVLICSYRAEQAELYCRAIEPQDYEMVEFLIKRLKLWIGLTKAKEFRHRVKFEGMDIPPSRASQESRPSTVFSSLPSTQSPSLSSLFSSPRPLSSSLSVRSEDSSGSEHSFDVQPFLDHLLPCVNALLARFDRVNQIIEDVHHLEVELEEALTRRRTRRISDKEKSAERTRESAMPKELEGEGRPVEVRRRRTGLLYPKPQITLPSTFSFSPSKITSPAVTMCSFPRTRSSYSESESIQLHHLPSGESHPPEAAKPADPSGFGMFPRRRAWHSGSSHSADAAQRMFQKQGGIASCGNGGESAASTETRPRSEEGVRRRISDGVPKKRKAWISEGPETEPV